MYQTGRIFKQIEYMKSICFICSLLICLSCGQEKIIQLPEINQSKIIEILDVSPAYLFYNETLPESIELNRKNLIITTNWLVNVDKRLTLKQAIPKVIFLQEKKRNASMHKNEAAKNYYTCHDTSIKNLGFIEFTDVVYHEESSNEYFNNHENKIKSDQIINIKVHALDSMSIEFFTKGCSLIHSSNYDELLNHLEGNLLNKGKIILISELNNNITFQDYITYKSLLIEFDLKNVTIANDEFIFN